MMTDFRRACPRLNPPNRAHRRAWRARDGTIDGLPYLVYNPRTKRLYCAKPAHEYILLQIPFCYTPAGEKSAVKKGILIIYICAHKTTQNRHIAATINPTSPPPTVAQIESCGAYDAFTRPPEFPWRFYLDSSFRDALRKFLADACRANSQPRPSARVSFARQRGSRAISQQRSTLPNVFQNTDQNTKLAKCAICADYP